MDDYAALVDRATGTYKILDRTTTGHDYLKPYWTTEGLDDTCWISLSDSDAVAVIDFATGTERAFLPVGDHPQRVRHGFVPNAVVASWDPVTPGPFGGPNGGSHGLINTVAAVVGVVLARGESRTGYHHGSADGQQLHGVSSVARTRAGPRRVTVSEATG